MERIDEYSVLIRRETEEFLFPKFEQDFDEEGEAFVRLPSVFGWHGHGVEWSQEETYVDNIEIADDVIVASVLQKEPPEGVSDELWAKILAEAGTLPNIISGISFSDSMAKNRRGVAILMREAPTEKNFLINHLRFERKEISENEYVLLQAGEALLSLTKAICVQAEGLHGHKKGFTFKTLMAAVEKARMARV